MKRSLKHWQIKKRLQILYELCQREETCVCDLTGILELPQSKLSYNLKLLLDANVNK